MQRLFPVTALLAITLSGGCTSIQNKLCNLVDQDSYVVVSVVGCQTIELSALFNADVDFSRLQSYAWSPAGESSTGAAASTADQLVNDWVTSAVDAKLAAKGFKQTTGTPDFLVSYTVPEENRATLTLTFADPNNRQRIWQGKAVDSAYPARNTISWELRLRAALDKLLEKFTPAQWQ